MQRCTDPLAPFRPPVERWGAGHRGVDLADAAGIVRSPADGVVAYAQPLAGRGVLVIRHAGGLRSTFEPVTGLLPVGAQVRRGQPVGQVAAAGSHCAARCLHWGVLRGRDYLDPLALLSARRVVLRPVD